MPRSKPQADDQASLDRRPALPPHALLTRVAGAVLLLAAGVVRGDEVLSAEPLFAAEEGVVTLTGGGACRWPQLCIYPQRRSLLQPPVKRIPKWGWLPGCAAVPYDGYAVPCGVRCSYVAPAAHARYRYPFP